ncbi:MAG TPA: sulfatase [Actinomycetota bacterium]|nr:sulfatase [Actinomycetota bacterium]
MDRKGTARGTGIRRVLAWIVGIALVASITWAGPAGATLMQGSAKHDPADGPVKRPNIVLILTDDQRWDTLKWMPNVQELLADHGVTFTNAFVPNSLCCPSRTTILTGRYSHSTGVWSNEWPFGGWKVFHGRGEEGSTIATWLHGAGYHTALIGKYLNDFGDAAQAGYVPPGWDRFVSFGNNNGAHYNYDLTIDGNIRPYGGDLSDFSTDVFADKAVNWIHSTQGPLFLYYAPYAPHEPYKNLPPRDDCPPLGPYDPPSFGEADVSDKPPYIADLPWTRADSSKQSWIRRGQCNLIKGVDRSVGQIVAALQATNRLSNTMIVFMSDNGYLWGEHRAYFKAKPYDEALRVPMVVRYDPMTKAPRTDSHLVLNVDIAQTFAALAGIAAPGTEGRSLLPLVAGANVPWRTDFLLEHSYGSEDKSYRAPDYCGLRSADWMYVTYMLGAQELYDLRSDPFELNNLARDPGSQGQLDKMRADVFRRCNPLPPRFPKP